MESKLQFDENGRLIVPELIAKDLEKAKLKKEKTKEVKNES